VEEFEVSILPNDEGFFESLISRMLAPTGLFIMLLLMFGVLGLVGLNEDFPIRSKAPFINSLMVLISYLILPRSRTRFILELWWLWTAVIIGGFAMMVYAEDIGFLGELMFEPEGEERVFVWYILMMIGAGGFALVFFFGGYFLAGGWYAPPSLLVMGGFLILALVGFYNGYKIEHGGFEDLGSSVRMSALPPGLESDIEQMVLEEIEGYAVDELTGPLRVRIKAEIKRQIYPYVPSNVPQRLVDMAIDKSVDETVSRAYDRAKRGFSSY